MKANTLTPSEAVYGFAAWLTTREKKIEMGASSNCSPAVEAVSAFCRENGLDSPRDGWEKNLVHPKL